MIRKSNRSKFKKRNSTIGKDVKPLFEGGYQLCGAQFCRKKADCERRFAAINEKLDCHDSQFVAIKKRNSALEIIKPILLFVLNLLMQQLLQYLKTYSPWNGE